MTQDLVNSGYTNTDVSDVIKSHIDKLYTCQDTTTPATGELIKIYSYYRNHVPTGYKADEMIIHGNVRPAYPKQHIALIIYCKTRETDHLLLCNRSATIKTSLQVEHVIYQQSCRNEECGPHSCTGMTRTILLRRLT